MNNAIIGATIMNKDRKIDRAASVHLVHGN